MSRGISVGIARAQENAGAGNTKPDDGHTHERIRDAIGMVSRLCDIISVSRGIACTRLDKLRGQEVADKAEPQPSPRSANGLLDELEAALQETTMAALALRAQVERI